MNEPRTPAAVQIDIDALNVQLDAVGDQIFEREQSATDYRAVLDSPNVGSENLATLAVLRERKRALEIARSAAERDLEGAEAHQHKLRLIAARAQIKATLKDRLTAAQDVDRALVTLARALHDVFNHGQVALLASSVNPHQHPLGEQGYIVIDGAQVLSDPTWHVRVARNLLDVYLGRTGEGEESPGVFVREIDRTNQGLLRQWDILNSTQKLQVIEHDPMAGADGTPAVTVEALDPDPTDDELADIAQMTPSDALRAIGAFRNSAWAKHTGLVLPDSTR